MTNPVLVEVTRGERVESRHRGAVAVVDARGKKVLALGDIEAAGLSALGREGDPGAAAGGSGRGRRVRFPRPRAGARAGLAWRRAGACGGRRRHAFGDRPRRDGARMRRARALARALRRRADPPRQGAEPAPQQLLRQAREFSGARAPSRHRPSRLCRRRASGAGDGARGAVEPDRRAARSGELRHRRLLDPDLCGAAVEPRAGLRPASRTGIGLAARARRRGATDLPGGRRRAVLRRRHRALLHRCDDAAAGRGAGEDRRGGRLLRRARRARPRRCAESRRRRDARRRGDDGGGRSRGFCRSTRSFCAAGRMRRSSPAAAPASAKFLPIPSPSRRAHKIA